MSNDVIRDIGEQGVLKRLQRFCPSDIVGDDAAIMPNPEPGQLLVVTTDVLVDGIHFSDRTTSAEDVGWRAVAANLSDLAAMGSSPLGITVGLSLPGDVAVSWVERLYQGMSECLQPYNTPIVGGDVCQSPVITVSITAFGQVLPQRVMRRSNAKVGDAIVVTGVHGGSRVGLELLLNPEFGKDLNEKERSRLIQAHQRPKPRLDILPQLWDSLASQSPIPLTAMDSSDGLADAIAQICRASGVGAVVERDAIPIPSVLPQLTSPEQVWDWVLYGGEDFELVLCLSEPLAQVFVEKFAAGSAIIGYITSGRSVCLRDSTGKYADELLTLSRGFQHF
ncbi:thiamine-monophosphate kinase [Coleofasciculus chthonoplastes PCC 7420]|uniref:Thiamine-monophosphate kinase n=1 Tax=Coleofasciculus chthonoplastes PCC 7420 TaxID=118168 RepID=B4VZ29_9CYAN|nr:thiamine-phosphate kinase [Coleofasciculus chthonoplastes]EDX72872.1 thiamine-monophosphate kinase [Coleofasciculus chthonoplastes PCC 7420]